MADDGKVQSLIERAVQGEQTAVQKLLLHHHDRLEAFLARRLPAHLRSAIGTEDVLQETYVCVFREIGTFRPTTTRSFRHWLFRIAEHRLFDEIRAAHAAKRGGDRKRVDARQRQSAGSVVDWLEHLVRYERSPSQSMRAREAVECVRSALSVLPPDYREALRLRYLEGLTVAETAVRMSRTEGAVCLLCHRALKKMHRALGDSTEFMRP